MREISADAWSVECDILCITTNKTIKNNRNVMGGGIAKEAAYRDASLPLTYARLIQQNGHHVFLIDSYVDYGHGHVVHHKPLLMFPTKEEVWENSNLFTITRSIEETKVLADLYGWKNIALPRPGAGLGGLDWHSKVKPHLEFLLHKDDRFIIVSYPGEE